LFDIHIINANLVWNAVMYPETADNEPILHAVKFFFGGEDKSWVSTNIFNLNWVLKGICLCALLDPVLHDRQAVQGSSWAALECGYRVKFHLKYAIAITWNLSVGALDSGEAEQSQDQEGDAS
jgi:hypothetical protein